MQESILTEPAAAFAGACDEMAASKYILADKKIAQLLECAVNSPELYGLFEECLTGFHYEMEFLKAKTPVFSEGGAKYRLVLPQSPTRLAAFVLCLLGELDAKSRDLAKFLGEYFEADSVYASYSRFCREVILPFRGAVLELLGYAQTPAPPTPPLPALDARSAEELLLILSELKGRASALAPPEKGEILSLADGLEAALASRNTQLTAMLWIGFRNTVKGCKPCRRQVRKIEERLRSLHIL